jgi:hypothetical protein
MGIKLFNYLPLNLKKLYEDVTRFKLKLGEFLSRVGEIDYIQVVFMYSNSLYYISLLYVFTCLYIDIVLCTAYFVFVLTFPRPGLYWIYGNKDDDDDDDESVN